MKLYNFLAIVALLSLLNSCGEEDNGGNEDDNMSQPVFHLSYDDADRFIDLTERSVLSLPKNSPNLSNESPNTIDKSIYFNEDEIIRIENNSFLNLNTDFTVSFWVKGNSNFDTYYDAKVALYGRHGNMSKFNIYNTGTAWGQVTDWGKPNLWAFVIMEDNEHRDQVALDYELDSQAWNFLTAVRRDNQLEIWVNGNLAATESIKNSLDFDLKYDSAFVGGNTEHPSNELYGSLFDLRVYQEALSADEIKTIMENI